MQVVSRVRAGECVLAYLTHLGAPAFAISSASDLIRPCFRQVHLLVPSRAAIPSNLIARY